MNEYQLSNKQLFDKASYSDIVESNELQILVFDGSKTTLETKGVFSIQDFTFTFSLIEIAESNALVRDEENMIAEGDFFIFKLHNTWHIARISSKESGENYGFFNLNFAVDMDVFWDIDFVPFTPNQTEYKRAECATPFAIYMECNLPEGFDVGWLKNTEGDCKKNEQMKEMLYRFVRKTKQTLEYGSLTKYGELATCHNDQVILHLQQDGSLDEQDERAINIIDNDLEIYNVEIKLEKEESNIFYSTFYAENPKSESDKEKEIIGDVNLSYCLDFDGSYKKIGEKLFENSPSGWVATYSCWDKLPNIQEPYKFSTVDKWERVDIISKVEGDEKKQELFQEIANDRNKLVQYSYEIMENELGTKQFNNEIDFNIDYYNNVLEQPDTQLGQVVYFTTKTGLRLKSIVSKVVYTNDNDIKITLGLKRTKLSDQWRLCRKDI